MRTANCGENLIDYAFFGCRPGVGPSHNEERYKMRQTVTSIPDPYQVAREYFRNQRAMEKPALYFLSEIPALLRRTPEERREIHIAKLAHPGCRIVQDG
jgi:hypothetical protein